MKIAFVVLVLLSLAVVGMLAVVRFAPIVPEEWHVDPFAAADPGIAGTRIAPPAAPVYPVTPTELAQALDRAVLTLPRSERIAGDPASGRVTYLLSTAIVGYRDMLTFEVRPKGEGATFALISRTRFTWVGDQGLNARRVAQVLQALDAGISAKGN